MASRLRNLLNQVKTELAAAHAHYDLSGTGAVKISHPPLQGSADGAPCAYVWLGVPVAAEHGRVMGDYTRRPVINIRAFVKGDTPADRLLNACDMADDLATALEANRSMNNGSIDLCDDLVVTVDVFDGSLYQLTSAGIVEISVEASWAVRTGL